MAMRSVEFLGKAEGIKTHELSVKSLIEKLNSSLSKLNGEKRVLERELSSLYAELAAAASDTNEDGYPDYNLIALIENQIDRTNEELSNTENNISETSGELQKAEKEYAEVEEEKQQTLFEIQERARITSQNASKASGMFGAWASVGNSLNQSFQAQFEALAKAASILDGSVSTAEQTGSGGNGTGRSGNGLRGNVSAGAAAIAASGTLTFSGISSSSMYSRQISGSKSIGGRFRYVKNESFNHERYNFNSFQQSGSVEKSFGGVIGTKTLLESSQESHCVERASKSRRKDSSKQFSNNNSVVKAAKKREDKRSTDNSKTFENIQTFQEAGDIVFNDKSPKTVRRGRNPFVDSLIVQDWELGRYSDYSLSVIRKNAADADYADYIKKPDEYIHKSYENKTVVYIDPATIKEIRGIDDPNFWTYKGTSYLDYIDMARQIPNVYSKLKKGEKLTDLAKQNDVIGACAKYYFLAEDITAMRVGNSYIFGGNGRHRIMAALIAGVNIPVRITDEFVKKKNRLDELEEKQEVLSEKVRSSNFRKNFAKKSSTISERIAKANKEELINIVRNEQIARNVDFGDIDINIARELVDTIQLEKNRYPFLNFSFIGSTQSFNKNLRKNIEVYLTRLYRENNPEETSDIISENVKLATDAYMRKFKIKEDELAVSISGEVPKKIARPKPGMEEAGYITEYIGDTVVSKLNGISINSENADNYSELCKELEEEEMQGASPRGCNSIKYLIKHEIAHQLDAILKLSEDPEIIREYEEHKKLSEKEQIANVCTYARKNIHEFIAEAWAESQCSTEPRRVARLIEEKIRLAAMAYMASKKGEDDYVRELEI